MLKELKEDWLGEVGKEPAGANVNHTVDAGAYVFPDRKRRGLLSCTAIPVCLGQ